MPDEAVKYENLPFDEAIAFFRRKVNIPTRRWNDLKKGMHARGFMVAGAMESEILADFRGTLDRVIAEGMTLRQFRENFDAIVKRHGWQYKGGRNWRSRVIFENNIRPVYMAGRYKQMTDPQVLKSRPFWEYRHGDSIHPRELHLSWDGRILAADNPWWQTHYPPNGWGCKCKVFARSARDLKKMGKAGPDTAPNDGTYRWTDKKTGATHTVPKGIDPGWDYNVGEAAWGRNQASRLMEDGGPWRDLSSWGPEKYDRPEKIAIDAAKATLGKPVRKGNEDAIRAALTKAIGKDDAVFFDPNGAPVMVTQAVVDHMLAKPLRLDGREAYFPFIPELIEDPFEIWAGFAKSEVSGRVALRKKYVKAVKIKKNVALNLVAETMNGHWMGLTFFRGNLAGIKNMRKGRLIYGR